MQNWDDLRYFLAVARAGSLTAASGILRVNQSTVSRRISAFEQEMQARLFERFSTGYVLTQEGEELLLRAEHIEEEAYAIERHVMGRNIELSGPILLTSSLVIARYFLIPLLMRFYKMHPGIVVHLDLSNNLHNLCAREADVAIRVTRDAIPETLIGRELGLVQYSVYGSQDYMTSYHKRNGEGPLHWIGEDNNQERPGWLPADINPLQLVIRSNDVLATLDMIKQGYGVGRLPCFVGDKEPSLHRLDTTQMIPPVPVWLLTHADMRRVNRISVFTAFIVEELRNHLLK